MPIHPWVLPYYCLSIIQYIYNCWKRKIEKIDVLFCRNVDKGRLIFRHGLQQSNDMWKYTADRCPFASCYGQKRQRTHDMCLMNIRCLLEVCRRPRKSGESDRFYGEIRRNPCLFSSCIYIDNILPLVDFYEVYTEGALRQTKKDRILG